MIKKGSIAIFLNIALVIFVACGSNNMHTTTMPLNEINTIVTLGASNAEILVALGFGEKIIAADKYSAGVEGLRDGVLRDFGFMDFDAEYLVSLKPDIVVATDMIKAGGVYDPLAPISAAGISVVYIPTSTSIESIMQDIRLIASIMQAYEAADRVIANMQEEIDKITDIAATITQRRSVYFEIAPKPAMFSFGSGTFLHEMIELVGATNIFEDNEGWIPVTEEVLLDLNPDVILTSVDFLEDPIAEILSRPGFDVITAVQNGDIFKIDANTSTRPSHNIVIALREIAQAIFPEYFLQ